MGDCWPWGGAGEDLLGATLLCQNQVIQTPCPKGINGFFQLHVLVNESDLMPIIAKLQCERTPLETILIFGALCLVFLRLINCLILNFCLHHHSWDLRQGIAQIIALWNTFSRAQYHPFAV
jgi:hypothetical protein